MRWTIAAPQIPQSIDDLKAMIFASIGITDVEHFLVPPHPMTLTPEDVGIDPSALAQASTMIRDAIATKKKIIIYGDYDCDGVCSTAVLWETLYEMGANVLPFIPDRHKHGYGLSMRALEEIYAGGTPDMIITVDNGIVAHDQWKWIREKGTTGILTDHHEPHGGIPQADVVIHTTALCGTTVAWMLARTLSPEKAATLLDLCAIATIADQVPLTGANRSFAFHGLLALNQTTRPGLLAILEVAGVALGNVNAGTIHYGIAPRINAIGRIEHALDALRTLVARSSEKAKSLVAGLHDANVKRQDMTSTMIDQARKEVERWGDEHIIVVDDTSFHEGIIGLIASKLTEEFFRPSIIIARGEVTSKASCRSIEGIHITNLLHEVRDDLLELGGHPMAAGFSIETAKIDLFREHLFALAKSRIHPDQLVPQIEALCEIPQELVTLETASMLATFAPFGAGNREPLVILRDVQILSLATVGKEGKHLKVTFASPDGGRPIQAIGFGMGSRYAELSSHPTLDLLGSITINEWNGNQSVQIQLKDITYDLLPADA